jgi:hypothetical protein
MSNNKVGEIALTTPNREQVLHCLWQIANLTPDITRGSVTGQIKALSMIIAMENFIPDRRAMASQSNSAPAPAKFYKSEWLRQQEANAAGPQPAPASEQEEAPQDPGPSQSTVTNPVLFSQTPAEPPYVPLSTPIPDARIPFSIKIHPR